MTNTRINDSSDVLVVRKTNKEIYKRFRQKALEENMNVGEALNQAMKYWLAKEKHKKLDVRRMLKLNGLIKKNNTVKWSEEIDELLYGGNV
jgi:septin family protein